MPYNMTEFSKEFTKEHLHLLEPSDRLQGMAAKDIKEYLTTILNKE